ncbi:hypothetical protein [Shewanella fodinae]|uniref:hypothetical protein n=1 Tax=Shewanella fodinae TaxID=552357 RepID=UPI0010564ECF
MFAFPSRNTKHCTRNTRHCSKSFPAHKPHSHYDLELSPGADGSHYLASLQHTLLLILQRHQPQLIFYDAGVDVRQDNELGLLALTVQDIYQRYKWILHLATTMEIPIVCVSGGGYCRDILQLVSGHSQLYFGATECFAN